MHLKGKIWIGGVKDQHVTSYLNPLLEMGHIFDSDKEFGPDLVKRRDLSNLVKLMDAKSISTEWNIKNFDIQGRWSGYEGAYYPRLGCGQISSAIYQQFLRLGGTAYLNSDIKSLDSNDKSIKTIEINEKVKSPIELDFLVITDKSMIPDQVLDDSLPNHSSHQAYRIIFVALLFDDEIESTFTTINVPKKTAIF